MSLVPFFYDPFYSDPWAELERPMRLFNQNFGMGLSLDDVLGMTPRRAGYLPRRTDLANREASGSSAITETKDKLEMRLDAQHFRPEELKVKVVDNAVVVEGKHEERSDEHGFIRRHFVRRYALPDSVDSEKVQSHLSAQGVLTITAPKKPEAIEGPKERDIPMQVEHQNAGRIQHKKK